MKKTKRRVLIFAFLILLVAIFFTIKDINEYMLRLQAYTAFHLIQTLYWVIILLLFVRVLIGDSGYLKMGAALGILVAIYFIMFRAATNEFEYTVLKSENYEVTLVIGEGISGYDVMVYSKSDILFTKYIDQSKIDYHYDVTYEIVGDNLIIEKCTPNGCQIEEIQLN